MVSEMPEMVIKVIAVFFSLLEGYSEYQYHWSKWIPTAHTEVNQYEMPHSREGELFAWRLLDTLFSLCALFNLFNICCKYYYKFVTVILF